MQSFFLINEVKIWHGQRVNEVWEYVRRRLRVWEWGSLWNILLKINFACDEDISILDRIFWETLWSCKAVHYTNWVGIDYETPRRLRHGECQWTKNDNSIPLRALDKYSVHFRLVSPSAELKNGDKDLWRLCNVNKTTKIRKMLKLLACVYCNSNLLQTKTKQEKVWSFFSIFEGFSRFVCHTLHRRKNMSTKQQKFEWESRSRSSWII